MSFKNQTAEQIAARLEAGEDLLLVDVREPDEWAIAAIEGAEQRSMSTLNDWWEELPRDREVVIVCHHGGRSAQVCQALAAQAGFENLTNMQGGIDRWAALVDPSLARY
ncbi:MAG TPA: rhodanese-like domain-containing protein [Herpetosiphonaceae bacterium]